MKPLHPWAIGPFELLRHAEGHLRVGEDFDRRIALISFDNAIEVAIATYLTLHPIQRGNRTYRVSDIDGWLANYHTKLDFLEAELVQRSVPWKVERSHIIWAHDHRNEQYHGGKKGTPEMETLALVRKAAAWVFELLFDDGEVEQRLQRDLAVSQPPLATLRNPAFDEAIDQRLGVIEIGDQAYFASELLYSVDYESYKDLGVRLASEDAAA